MNRKLVLELSQDEVETILEAIHRAPMVLPHEHRIQDEIAKAQAKARTGDDHV